MSFSELSGLTGKISSTDDLLHALGLEHRRTFSQSCVAATSWMGAGILIGAGLALLLAPRNGTTARGQVGHVDAEGSRPLTQM